VQETRQSRLPRPFGRYFRFTGTDTEVVFCPDRIIDFNDHDAGVKCLASVGATLSGFTICRHP
jgi:hypothetical protein